MKNKYISIQSGKLLTYFNQKDQKCFDYLEALEALPKSNKNTVRKLLSDMIRRGLLMSLKNGLYYIIPYEEDSEYFMPNWHLTAKYLTQGAKYYIGYYSALQIHNLITQPSLKEQIVVGKQIRPSSLVIKKIPFQFIYHNEKHFFGVKKIWIDNYNKVCCSDLEKTIIDCLFKPDYAGGIAEVSRAIYVSRDKINFDKLLKYAIDFKSQAVIKRLGFILELLEIDSQITKKLFILKTPSYTLLDTELPKSGKIINRWSIQQNLDSETIKSTIYT